MEYKNKFQDNQAVKHRDTGEILTVNRWGYVPSMKRYTYTVKETIAMFYFEEELEAATIADLELQQDEDGEWR